MTRILAISDLHVDIRENRQWLERHCDDSHTGDVLLVAGDVSSNLSQLEAAFRGLVRSYDQVYFVPGNHDLWIGGDDAGDSLGRWQDICELCGEVGVQTSPGFVTNDDGVAFVRVAPLLSWYAYPEESSDSLFHPKPGEDNTMAMWVDRIRIRWPGQVSRVGAADYFLSLNEDALREMHPCPVVSLSHFLPRQGLIFTSEDEKQLFQFPTSDRAPSFNFSRVAGTAGLERQIRALGSAVHVHGHQHRNRDRVIDGVRYVSYSLGYPQERAAAGIDTNTVEPMVVFEATEKSHTSE